MKKISIISPASAVRHEYVEGADRFLREHGFEIRLYPSATGDPYGSYSAPLRQRLRDFIDAWTDPETDIVLCARGGYGCIHLLPLIPDEILLRNRKLLVGFSDISALHALMHSKGIPSLHAPMAKHLFNSFPGADGKEPDAEVSLATESLLRVFHGGMPLPVVAPHSPFNRPGVCEGTLLGGNLAVLNSLAQTPWDMLAAPMTEDVVLFIEDVSEAIYAVERMLCRLMLAGILPRVKGLVVGRFTEYRADRNFGTMEEMIHYRLREWGFPQEIPVAYDFPVGHIEGNMPLMCGARVRLTVPPADATSVAASDPALSPRIDWLDD